MKNQDETLARGEASAPSACPSCGARDLTTVSKTVDVSTYWRCVKCGEIWNVSRRGSGNKPLGRRWSSW